MPKAFTCCRLLATFASAQYLWVYRDERLVWQITADSTVGSPYGDRWPLAVRTQRGFIASSNDGRDVLLPNEVRAAAVATALTPGRVS